MPVWLRMASRSRAERIGRELPDFLDALGVTVGAGLSFRQTVERAWEDGCRGPRCGVRTRRSRVHQRNVSARRTARQPGRPPKFEHRRPVPGTRRDGRAGVTVERTAKSVVGADLASGGGQALGVATLCVPSMLASRRSRWRTSASPGGGACTVRSVGASLPLRLSLYPPPPCPVALGVTEETGVGLRPNGLTG